jgi:hypothetical protein
MAATTPQLGLVTPTQGDLTGTWGNTVNNGITEYTDIAIAGTLTLTGDGAVTLANTLGDDSASNITSSLAGAGTVTAQFAIVKVSGTTTTKEVTGPSYSKTYVVDNASSFAVTFKASGQAGVSVAVGEKCTVYFNGTDYVKVASSVVDGVSTFSGGTTGLTPSTATSGAVTLSGTLAVANGGTNLTSFTANGVVYASSSSALTTGSALTFDGTHLSLTTANAIYKVPTAGGSLFDAGGNNGIYILGSSNYVATYAAGSEQMRLTSTGLGIGTSSPAYKLHVSNYMGLGTQASSGAGAGISMIPSSTLTNWFVGSNYVNSGAFEIIPSTAGGGSTFSTPALVLNSSGNLGLGIAPSAFGATYKAFQPTGYAAYVGDSYYGRAEILNNAYASNINVFNYFDTNSAGRYSLQLGVHAWYNAPSGTAGDTITFSQVMTLDASGNLGLGTTSPFSAANQTSLTINATTYPRLDFYSGGTQRAFINSGSTDTNIYTVGATPLTFGTNNTERARIDSSGNVGIGTSSPSKKLDVYLGTTGTVEQYLRNNTINLLSKIDGTTSAQFGTETSHPLVFLTGNTERARITSGGTLALGQVRQHKHFM